MAPTPLQWAARNGLVEVIDLLIQHGANPQLFDTEGYNCFHSVRSHGLLRSVLASISFKFPTRRLLAMNRRDLV